MYQIGDRVVDGEVFNHEGSLCLRLSNDRSTAPRQRNTIDGERAPMGLNGASWEPTEECFVRFYEANIFGIVKTSNAAPSHSTVAAWINRALPQPERVKAQPLVDSEQFRRLAEMREVSVATFAMRPKDAELPHASTLGRRMSRMSRELGSGIRVEVKVSVSPGSAYDEERVRMFQEAMGFMADLSSESGTDVEKAVVRARPRDGGPVESIDLIEASLTRKVDVSLSGVAEDRSVNEHNAAEAIREAYEELRAKLLAAVAADRFCRCWTPQCLRRW